MSSKPVFLDVDSSIVERNLKITDDAQDEEFNKLFQQPGDQYPGKLIKPSPGFCIKTKEIGTDVKIFINICKCDGLPPPKDLTESELEEILNTDSITEYKVSMSIGELRAETDKKGEDAKVCDVAINDKFFDKLENSMVFKRFVMTLSCEAVSHKHDVFFNDDMILLKNRKAYGTLQVHRIQQRDVDEKMGKNKPKSLIEEIGGGGDDKPKPKPKIEVLSSENGSKCPEYRLFKNDDDPNVLYSEVRLPNVISSKELTLDVGEDRIIVESKEKKYLLDIFLPFCVNEQMALSRFNRDTKILTVTMPIQVGDKH